MAKRLCGLTKGDCAVIIRVKKAPRLQTLGLQSGTVVRCKYKSGCVMVLEGEGGLIALPIRQLRRVWADY